jgi:hypothetical protein
MPILALANPHDLAIWSAGVLVKAVLDGVPRKSLFDHLLGFRVNLASTQRLVCSKQHLDHRLLNRTCVSAEFGSAQAVPAHDAQRASESTDKP